LTRRPLLSLGRGPEQPDNSYQSDGSDPFCNC
jgi:hypothetical protein